MAIAFPLTMPSVGSIRSIEIRSNNAVAISQSPFTYESQAQKFPGQRWVADVSLAPMKRADAEQWVAWMLSLNGSYGTFLLGDPLGTQPRGTVSSATITGSVGASSVAVTMTGTLLAGDWIQLGAGISASLHKVLVDQSGSGTLEIYPALRRNVTSEAVSFTNAKGVFRLSSNESAYSISNVEIYGMNFGAMEAVF